MTETPGSEVIWTIVVGAGSGDRFGGPKQYETLGGERVIDRSRRIAADVSDGVVTVVAAADAAAEGAVAGGATRATSVRAGLAHVPDDATIVLVHDAARPLASRALYQSVIDAVAAGADAAIPATAVTDTVKLVDGDAVVGTADRSNLVTVQTPQGFRAGALRGAHASGAEGTDDAVLVEQSGGQVRIIAGEPTNVKLTRPIDLVIADALLEIVDGADANAPVGRSDAVDRPGASGQAGRGDEAGRSGRGEVAR